MPAGDQQAALNEQARAAAERNALNERIHSLEGQLQQAQHRSAQLRAQHADLLAQADAAVQRAVGRAAAVHGRMQLKMDMAGQASGRIHVLSWRRAAGWAAGSLPAGVRLSLYHVKQDVRSTSA